MTDYLIELGNECERLRIENIQLRKRVKELEKENDELSLEIQESEDQMDLYRT
jgi:hypothetical protein